MSRLDEAAKSVPAGSPPADENQNLATDGAAENPLSLGNEDDGSDPGDDGKPGRSLDNVRGEFQRKFEGLQRDNQRMADELAALRDQPAAPAPSTPAPETQATTLDDMSIADLEAMRPKIDADKKDAFDAYLIDRKVQHGVKTGLDEFRTEHTFEQKEQVSNERAFSRWPQLHNQSSDFWQTTNRILKEMGETADSNPGAVLHAANEAGLELGIKPQSFRPEVTRRDPVSLQSGRSSRPGPRDRNEVDINSDEHKAIQRTLGSVMPGRKFSDKQLTRIAKNTKKYVDNIDLFTRG